MDGGGAAHYDSAGGALMWTDRPGTGGSGGGFDPAVPLTFLLMTSPDGTVWSMTVNDAGAWVSVTARATEDGQGRLTEDGQPRLLEAG